MTQTVTGAKLAAEAWESLFRAQVALMRLFAEEDIWDPVSMREYDVLFTLSKAPAAGLRLNELNRQVLMSQPSLSRLVERLAARGLLERGDDEADRRGTLIALTRTGRALQRKIGHRHAESIRRHLEPALSAGELNTLRDLCTKLRLAQG